MAEPHSQMTQPQSGNEAVTAEQYEQVVTTAQSYEPIVAGVEAVTAKEDGEGKTKKELPTMDTSQGEQQAPESSLTTAQSTESVQTARAPVKKEIKTHWSVLEPNVRAMKVAELREELELRVLDSKGVKNVLMQRLLDAIEKEKALAKEDGAAPAVEQQTEKAQGDVQEQPRLTIDEPAQQEMEQNQTAAAENEPQQAQAATDGGTQPPQQTEAQEELAKSAPPAAEKQSIMVQIKEEIIELMETDATEEKKETEEEKLAREKAEKEQKELEKAKEKFGRNLPTELKVEITAGFTMENLANLVENNKSDDLIIHHCMPRIEYMLEKLRQTSAAYARSLTVPEYESIRLMNGCEYTPEMEIFLRHGARDCNWLYIFPGTSEGFVDYPGNFFNDLIKYYCQTKEPTKAIRGLNIEWALGTSAPWPTVLTQQQAGEMNVVEVKGENLRRRVHYTMPNKHNPDIKFNISILYNVAAQKYQEMDSFIMERVKLGHKLYYFDTRGEGEPIRLLLNYAKQPFEDVRVGSPKEWEAMKSKSFYGKLPVLEVDGKKMDQSAAILRYFGEKLDLAGKDEWERAKVNELIHFYEDINSTLSPYMYVKAGFEQGDLQQLRKDVFLPNAQTNIAPLVNLLKESDSGFLVPSGVTIVDFPIADYLYSLKKAEPDVIGNYPELVEYIDKVYALPQLEEYMAKRKDTDI